MFSLLSTALSIISGEWVLTDPKRCYSNGGVIILLRALWTALVVFAMALAVTNALDPDLTWQFDPQALRRQIVERGPSWFGAIFAATYAALYARFASQWNYLATLYNRIKETECRMAEGAEAKLAMAQWKAGFIEDAADLHLAMKPMFASVIKYWGADPAVAAEFKAATVGHQRRLESLLLRVDAAVAQAELKF